MFPSFNITRPALNQVSKAFSRYLLVKHLPVLAVHWFQNIERISGGLIRLKFDPEEALAAIHSRNPWGSDLAKSVIIANSRWNVIWAQYCVELLDPVKEYPGVKRSLKSLINRNILFLEWLEEKPVPKPDYELINRSGKTGYDLIAGDLIGNTYTDLVWGSLVAGLERFTIFRRQYVEITNSGPAGNEAALMAKSIALAEIAWSNELFPWRDVTDMMACDLSWRAYFRTGMYDNFLRAANLAGAGLPELSSKEIIHRIAANPDMPIEDVLA